MTNSLRIKLIIVVILLLLSTVVSTVLFVNDWNMAGFFVAILALAFVISLARIYTATTRKVAYMFDAIENDDFAFRFMGNSRRLTADVFLNQSLNRIKGLVESARRDAREKEKYYEIILSRVQTGVIVLNEQGVIFQTNPRALQLLGVSQLTHIRQLDHATDVISDKFLAMGEGESRMVKFYNEVSEVSLNLTATYAILRGNILKIVAVTDIADNLDSEQVESWQRMSRVLTHEIMNTLAPITSLCEMLLETNDAEVIRRGLEVINTTSGDLRHFVENYRKMTRLPQPKLDEIDISKVVKREVQLMNIDAPLTIKSPVCTVFADSGMISQVVVNLLKNAVEAAEESQEKGRVWVEIARDLSGRLYVDVCNTGNPIPEEVRENMFVPFFTTKEHGNGVGLSLSKQIMRLNQGSLTLTTKPHTRFRMQFQ